MGSADPLGELKRSPRPPNRNMGPTSKRREREGKRGEVFIYCLKLKIQTFVL